MRTPEWSTHGHRAELYQLDNVNFDPRPYSGAHLIVHPNGVYVGIQFDCHGIPGLALI